jgi:CRP-like cAMP-binding protein
MMATRLPSFRAQRAAARLKKVSDRLHAMQSSVTVAVAALRSQNADIDEDVARLLVRSVSDPLQEQIDSIKSVLRLLAHSTRDKR